MNECIAAPLELESSTINWDLESLDCEYDDAVKALYCRMCAKPRPSFSPQLLDDIQKFQRQVKAMVETAGTAVDYLILGSTVEGVFNLGGDLSFFVETIRAGKRDVLEAYAIQSIDVLYANYIKLDQEMTTIALIEGDALGAAFEAALSFDVIIAEKGVQIGFPEVAFNMFPGMGAYSFMARRVAPHRVEKMITSGKMYSADELYAMGIIDVLAEPGQGHKALHEYIRRHKKMANTRRAVLNIRNRVFPVTYDELKDIALMWVDSALNLSERDLKMMERLVKAQGRRLGNAG